MSSKFHLSKWKTYFSQFIDKFLKIEEVEYLIHYVKFKMRSVPILTQRLKTGILNVALGCTFQFFQIDERDKKLEFYRLGPA